MSKLGEEPCEMCGDTVTDGGSGRLHDTYDCAVSLRSQLTTATARASELERECEAWRTAASMACESPPDRCDCAGCRFAEQLNAEKTDGKGETNGDP